MKLQLKQKRYPDKTTVNLVVRERTPRQVSQAVCLAVILMVVVAVFAKFAVIDRLAAASRAEAAAAAVEQELARLQAQNVDYDRVQLEYQRYFSKELTQEQAGSADCMEVLDLLETKLMRGAQVASAAFSSNVLSLQLTGISLDGTSALLADLYTNPLVTNVELYTAAEADSGTVTLTITLAVEGGDAS